MRVLSGVLMGLAGLALSGVAAQGQEYGYYRYFGPGPYAYEPPAYYAPPPPPRYYEPAPPYAYYGYAQPDAEYDGYVPPPPRGYYRSPEPDYYVPPPPRQRQTPPASATAKPRTKTASATTGATGPVSCTKAQDVVAGYGFGNVKPVTCAGKIFDFSALRDGKPYRVQVSAATGEITEVRKQP